MDQILIGEFLITEKEPDKQNPKRWFWIQKVSGKDEGEAMGISEEKLAETFEEFWKKEF